VSVSGYACVEVCFCGECTVSRPLISGQMPVTQWSLFFLLRETLGPGPAPVPNRSRTAASRLRTASRRLEESRCSHTCLIDKAYATTRPTAGVSEGLGRRRTRGRRGSCDKNPTRNRSWVVCLTRQISFHIFSPPIALASRAEPTAHG